MIVVGVDCHKGSLAACAVDSTGNEVATASFTNTTRGHRALARWARRCGDVARFGLEGAGNYGHALATMLLAAGAEVVDVPAQLTFRERRRSRRPGKSDAGDALAIARVVLREAALPPVRSAGVSEDLKLLVDYREQLVAERVRVANQLHADLSIAYPGYEQRWPALTSKSALTGVRRMLARDRSVRAELARLRLSQLRQLDAQARELEQRIHSLVALSGTTLTDIRGIGALLAARIIGEVRDIRRFPSPAHFASANGTAPIPASSGYTQRHRLNRGGNRRLNRALHIMAIIQSRSDPRARAYLERKRLAGKSWTEALRCLKRRLSDVVYRQLQFDVRAA